MSHQSPPGIRAPSSSHPLQRLHSIVIRYPPTSLLRDKQPLESPVAMSMFPLPVNLLSPTILPTQFHDAQQANTIKSGGLASTMTRFEGKESINPSEPTSLDRQRDMTLKAMTSLLRVHCPTCLLSIRPTLARIKRRQHGQAIQIYHMSPRDTCNLSSTCSSLALHYTLASPSSERFNVM